jgi:hypothetical protein
MKTAGLAVVLLVTVAATATAQKAARTATESSPDQRAPKGMCRIWLKDVPAAQQPAPTDCAAAVKNCPPNGRVIFGETDPSKPKPTRDSTEASDSKKSLPLVKSLVDSKKSKTPPPTVVPRKPPG